MSFLFYDAFNGKLIDMYAPYMTLIKMVFSNAKIILDKFHILKLPNPPYSFYEPKQTILPSIQA